MKKIISIVLLVTILIVNINTVNVFASGYQPNDGGYWSSLWGDVENGVLQGYQQMLRTVGFIVDTQIAVGRTNVQFVKDRLQALGLIGSNASEQDVEDFFKNNVTDNGTNVELSNNLNVYLKSEANEIINNTGYKYLYSLNVYPYYSFFQSPDQYNKFKNLISANKHKLCLFATNSSNLLVFDNESDIGFVHARTGTYYDVCTGYNYSNWTEINTINATWYAWDGQNNEWRERSSVNATGQPIALMYDKDTVTSDFNTSWQNWWVVSDANVKTYIEYSDLSTLQASTVGLKPYYVSDSWNNYISDSNNTYTIDSSTNNNITYGDITNYINSYNTENGTEPTTNDIQIYINNNIPDSNGSGGSGGGSGGDSGSDDDNNGSIFDWLSKIGTLIGNLISGVGGFIAGVLEGVVNALTSILDTITSIITTITTSIPDNFNTLMTTILGWLPEEWTAVISAFLLVSLLVGLFKLFRG